MTSQVIDHFNQDKIIKCKDFISINDVQSECNSIICLISFTEMHEFNNEQFKNFINLIGKCKYILLIKPEETKSIKSLLKTGGKSFLLHDDPIEFMIDCIEKTIEFGGYISPRIVSLMNEDNELIIKAQNFLTLTHRAVLIQLLLGKSDKMIADTMNISYHTMKTHRKKLYKIFNVHSQGELFALLH